MRNFFRNSENPKMADIIIKFSDILKSCTPFLLKKAQFVEEMSNLRRDNKDFDQATLSVGFSFFFDKTPKC